MSSDTWTRYQKVLSNRGCCPKVSKDREGKSEKQMTGQTGKTGKKKGEQMKRGEQGIR